MSDSLPEKLFSGAVRVVKLISGEEIISFVIEAAQDKFAIKYPALLQTFMIRDSKGDYEEYVKLTNYVSNITGFEITIPRNMVLYIGNPNQDLQRMYEVYVMAMQNDPKSMVSSFPEGENLHNDTGLHLLNDLFNNEDFVNFVNDLIDNFEGIEIEDGEDDDEDEDENDSVAESIISPVEEETSPNPPKRKKRKRIKPETNKMPYNPESPPENPESWSDDPKDYLN